VAEGERNCRRENGQGKELKKTWKRNGETKLIVWKGVEKVSTRKRKNEGKGNAGGE
jgi:hypothetical protein